MKKGEFKCSEALDEAEEETYAGVYGDFSKESKRVCWLSVSSYTPTDHDLTERSTKLCSYR